MDGPATPAEPANPGRSRKGVRAKPEIRKVRKTGKQKPSRQDLLLQAKEPTSGYLLENGYSPDEILQLLIERKRLGSR
jgi:hypothetical protein